jgi:hypothetical protein
VATFAELEEAFNRDGADLVAEVTDFKSLAWLEDVFDEAARELEDASKNRQPESA